MFNLWVCWFKDGVMWPWQYSPVASAEWDAAFLSSQPGWIPLNGLHRCGLWGGKLFGTASWWSNTVSEQTSHWKCPGLCRIGRSMNLKNILKTLLLKDSLWFSSHRFASSRSGYIIEIDYSRVVIRNVRRLLPAHNRHANGEKLTFNTGASEINHRNIVFVIL